VGLWTATAPFTVTVTRRFAFLASGSTGAAALTSLERDPRAARLPDREALLGQRRELGARVGSWRRHRHADLRRS
jgi:hypothetical protein